MLNDWEERRLEAIAHELGSDKALRRLFSEPTPRELRLLAFRQWFYPTGYLGCALAYMVLAMGAAAGLGTLARAALVALLVWIVLEVRLVGTKELVRRLGRWLDR